jgi:hypothetical protein
VKKRLKSKTTRKEKEKAKRSAENENVIDEKLKRSCFGDRWLRDGIILLSFLIISSCL